MPDNETYAIGDQTLSYDNSSTYKPNSKTKEILDEGLEYLSSERKTYKPFLQKTLNEGLEHLSSDEDKYKPFAYDALQKMLENNSKNDNPTTVKGSATSKGSWNFTADSDIQIALSDKLAQAANNFETSIANMYQKIDSLGINEYWVGEDYNSFQKSSHSYEKAVASLADNLKMYSEHYKKMSDATDSLSTELINIVYSSTTRHSK